MSAVVIGAGPGLGMALARAYGHTGRNVALIARRPDALRLMAETLGREGVSAQAIAGDASDTESLTAAITAAAKAVGAVDVVHYNASFLAEGTPSQVDLRDVELAWRVGCLGAWAALQAAVPLMTEEGGHFFVTGGGLALDPWPPASGLASAKAAVRNMVFAAASELRDTGVRVATVTVKGVIAEGSSLSPAAIASTFVDLIGAGQIPVETVLG